MQTGVSQSSRVGLSSRRVLAAAGLCLCGLGMLPGIGAATAQGQIVIQVQTTGNAPGGLPLPGMMAEGGPALGLGEIVMGEVSFGDGDEEGNPLDGATNPPVSTKQFENYMGALDFTPEQAEAARTVFRQRMDNYRQKAQEMQSAMREGLQKAIQSAMENHEQGEPIQIIAGGDDAMAERATALAKERQAQEQGVLDDLKSLATKEQLARWSAVEQQRRRDKAVSGGFAMSAPGVRANLRTLVEEHVRKFDPAAARRVGAADRQSDSSSSSDRQSNSSSEKSSSSQTSSQNSSMSQTSSGGKTTTSISNPPAVVTTTNTSNSSRNSTRVKLPEPVEQALLEYEGAIDADAKALLELNERDDKADKEQAAAAGAGKEGAAMPDFGRMGKMYKEAGVITARIRGANQRFAGIIGQQWPAEQQAEWDQSVRRAMYPGIYRPTHGERVAEAALAMNDLTDEQRASVMQGLESLRGKLPALRQRAVEDAIKQQEIMADGFDTRGINYAAVEHLTAMTAQQDIATAEGALVKQVRDLLSDEQKAKLPKRAGGGMMFGGPGAPAAAGANTTTTTGTTPEGGTVRRRVITQPGTR
jgi:uncharacterized protein YdbL (DUF1318 family)